ncbi:MAG: hypothetical protein NZ895_01040 [Archaeoglobaceae archaeon]|nr:hypothetical protein [Archaeoglobaceae archaeon]MCX8152003.1 hypothetical protein [Archaeoglobaceae archaeon]MDW8013392.1 hypothetical protein [Archaeoglobaceae archaeon]
MLRISKFLKFEVEVLVVRDSLNEGAVIFFHPEFAKKIGIKENDLVEVSKGDKVLRLRAKLSNFAPENGAYMPNNIFSSYFTENNFKKFKANVEIADGKESTVEEILDSL